MTLDGLIDAAHRVQEELSSGEAMRRIILRYEAEICDMNAQAQLYELGVNAVGVNIMDYKPYSPLTVQIKKEMGQPYNRVTLRDTGDFHRSFYIDADGEKFTLSAADEKTEGLVRKYGRQIFGLTDENREELVAEYVYPDLRGWIIDTIKEKG